MSWAECKAAFGYSDKIPQLPNLEGPILKTVKRVIWGLLEKK